MYWSTKCQMLSVRNLQKIHPTHPPKKKSGRYKVVQIDLKSYGWKNDMTVWWLRIQQVSAIWKSLKKLNNFPGMVDAYVKVTQQ